VSAPLGRPRATRLEKPCGEQSAWRVQRCCAGTYRKLRLAGSGRACVLRAGGFRSGRVHKKLMKPFSLLIKPTSADCNLRCDYCFYLSRAALYPHTSRHRMSAEVLEQLIRTYLATDQPQYVFLWQGGEPTLMGLEFFRRVTSLQRKYGRPGAVVANGVQTNGVLIDDALAAHWAAYHFLVGVSLDGPAAVHDRYRRTSGGHGSHSRVLQGIECLKRHGVEFNALVLVSTANVERGREIYEYLCELGIYYHQYIPCVEFDPRGRPLPFTITASQWGDFLCAVFDAWLAGDFRRVSVRLFDSILVRMLGGDHTICHMGRNCCQYFVVEYNGDVYPCDFFVEADTKLGNIMQDSWQALHDSPAYRAFGRQKSAWHKRCASCPYLDYCAGDCLKHRLYGGQGPRALSWLCEGWRQFYSHALPKLTRLAAEIGPAARGQAVGVGTRRPAAPLASARRPGRNDPCPCGSGKKFKHCCGAQ
jgi:uncharacterized protein